MTRLVDLTAVPTTAANLAAWAPFTDGTCDGAALYDALAAKVGDAAWDVWLAAAQIVEDQLGVAGHAVFPTARQS